MASSSCAGASAPHDVDRDGAQPGFRVVDDNPEAWLRTVAVNVVRRRWRRRKLLDAILLRDRPVTRLVEAAPGPERADLRRALAALPESFRQVVVLHYFADLPVDEIAALLEVPTGTVKSRLSRARVALAGQLGDYSPTRPAPPPAVRPAVPHGDAEVAHA